MSALKIYLNENLSWKIAKALREYGHNAVSSHEVGMNAEDDDVQFDFAVSEKRAVLTDNFGDFVK
jgi:predicted nuclease of predicted toxin-antitoxin system